MKVQLTFRSGAQAVIDVERLQVTHDGPTKAITAVQWNDADAGNRLLGLVPTEVVAVVELDATHPGVTGDRQHHDQHEAESG